MVSKKTKKATGYHGYVLFITKEKETKNKQFKDDDINSIMNFIGELYGIEALIIDFSITMNK